MWSYYKKAVRRVPPEWMAPGMKPTIVSRGPDRYEIGIVYSNEVLSP